MMATSNYSCLNCQGVCGLGLTFEESATEAQRSAMAARLCNACYRHHASALTPRAAQQSIVLRAAIHEPAAPAAPATPPTLPHLGVICGLAGPIGEWFPGFSFIEETLARGCDFTPAQEGANVDF